MRCLLKGSVMKYIKIVVRAAPCGPAARLDAPAAGRRERQGRGGGDRRFLSSPPAGSARGMVWAG